MSDIKLEGVPEWFFIVTEPATPMDGINMILTPCDFTGLLNFVVSHRPVRKIFGVYTSYEKALNDATNLLNIQREYCGRVEL